MSILNNTNLLQDLLDTVNALPEAGVELPELTNEGSASDLLSGKQLIDSDGNIVTGTIATKTSSNLTASGATVTVPAGYYASNATKSVATATQATPSVSIDSAGKITASATQTAGYVSAGTKTGTKQLTTQAAKTITPTKSSQTAVAKDVYTTGVVTVAAIPSQYITTTDATASADEIMNGETAYVNGSKVTGTFSIDSELSTQDDLITQIQSALAGKAGGSAAPTLQEKTVTPSASSQTVTADSGYDGLSKVTVSGDTNLVAENIAEGVSIFGVSGTHSGGGNLETCSLSTGAIHNRGVTLTWTEYSNGEIIPRVETISSSPNTILSECVLKKSIISAELQSTQTTNLTALSRYPISYTVDGDATVSFKICLVRNTPIYLANGIVKLVQDVTYHDDLLVWDFDNGCYSAAKPLWIKRTQVTSYYYHCIFDNGSTLDLVGSDGKCHRLFSIDENCFLSATDCVGMTIMTHNGLTKLLSCERVDKEVEFYNIITNYHLNLYANGILTSCRLNNLYKIEDMKFVKEERDIISINEYQSIDDNFYDGLRLSERKEEDVKWINNYVQRLYALMLKEV